MNLKTRKKRRKSPPKKEKVTIEVDWYSELPPPDAYKVVFMARHGGTWKSVRKAPVICTNFTEFS